MLTPEIFARAGLTVRTHEDTTETETHVYVNLKGERYVGSSLHGMRGALQDLLLDLPVDAAANVERHCGITA